MTKQKWILSAVVLLMIGGSAGFLHRVKGNQKLGEPGVKIDPNAENRSHVVLLPENVLDYESEQVDQDDIVLGTLPQDTSFGQRRYTAPDGFNVQVNVVLMKGDRTSIHKPQFCLEGAGWQIDGSSSRKESVHVERPFPYDLPVMKLIATKEVEQNGQRATFRGVYVYWFVAEDAYTAEHWERMWWMARELVKTGELQRWAYVSYFAACLPGQEDATFERMKKLIAASVPEFQLTPGAEDRTAVALPQASENDPTRSAVLSN